MSCRDGARACASGTSTREERRARSFDRPRPRRTLPAMTRWLDADQQKHWRAYIAATTLLQERLSRELQAAHGLTMADYEILVRLSEAGDLVDVEARIVCRT